ncbi:hypothetical protein ALP03_05861 [Pseudomonas amygdali pv. tabaci]|uniref:Uncharacterized protein n=1 Tax=Pseudomonas amygdali pv. tabaci TaxID=322 RepID=A0A3M6H4U8_PSEAJ|nr:hypothetical protein ALP03_05861 [Pseudomonas amygdali pv. tabaci]
MDLIVSGNFNQLYGAFSPIAQGLDPQARPPFIMHAIQVMAEFPIPLQQTETSRVIVTERRCHGSRRVVQRSPYSLACTGPDRQSVGVMHLGPPVSSCFLGLFAEPVHRTDRRDAEPLHFAAHEQCGLDLHHHPFATLYGKAIRPTDTRPVKQCIDNDRVGCIAVRRFKPEVSKVGKFFRTLGLGDIQRNTPCGKSILIQLANGTKVGSAEKSRPIVITPIQFFLIACSTFLKAKPGKANTLSQLTRRAVFGHVEIRLIVENFPGSTLIDNIEPHRLGEKLPRVEKSDRKLARSLREQCVLRLEANLAVSVVVQFRQYLRRKS